MRYQVIDLTATKHKEIVPTNSSHLVGHYNYCEYLQERKAINPTCLCFPGEYSVQSMAPFIWTDSRVAGVVSLVPMKFYWLKMY